MRHVSISMFALAPVLLAGCLYSADDQQKLDELGAEIAQLIKDGDDYQKELRGLPARIRSGELTAEEGQRISVGLINYMGRISSATRNAQDTMEMIQSKSGKAKWLGYGMIIMGILAGTATGGVGLKLKLAHSAIRGITTVLHKARKINRQDTAERDVVEDIVADIANLQNKTINNIAKEQPPVGPPKG